MSSIIYQFKCQCNAAYIGRTDHLLKKRTSQLVPANIHKGQFQNLHKCMNMSESEIVKYLKNNQ